MPGLQGRPPSPPGFSFWQLFSLYKSCPYSYKIAFLGRQRPAIKDRMRLIHLTFRGAVFHDLMEHKVFNQWDWSETLKKIEEVWQGTLTRSVGAEVSPVLATQVLLEISSSVERMINSEHRRVFDSIVEAEKPIYSELKGNIIKGRVDAVGALENVGSFYLDWKLQDTVSSTASKQLAFYCVVNPVDKAFVYYPMLDELKPVRLSEKRLVFLKEEVIQIINAIKRNHFPKTYSRCKFCFYYEVCRPRVRARR